MFLWLRLRVRVFVAVLLTGRMVGRRVVLLLVILRLWGTCRILRLRLIVRGSPLVMMRILLLRISIC